VENSSVFVLGPDVPSVAESDDVCDLNESLFGASVLAKQ